MQSVHRVAQSNDKPADLITFSHLVFSSNVINEFRITRYCATTPSATMWAGREEKEEQKGEKKKETAACNVN